MAGTVDPLANLRDIYLPPEPAFWPPAPGWWLITLVVLLSLFIFGWLAWRRHQRLRPVISALAILADLRDQHRRGVAPPTVLAAQLSALIRRVALWRFADEPVAGLTGSNWLRFLDRVLGDTQFSQGPGRWLLTAPYARSTQAELDSLFALTQRWINRTAQRPPTPRA